MEVIGSFSHYTFEDGSRYSRSHLQRCVGRSNPFPSSEKTFVKMVKVIVIRGENTFINSTIPSVIAYRWLTLFQEASLELIRRCNPLFYIFIQTKKYLQECSQLEKKKSPLSQCLHQYCLSLETRLSIAVFISGKLRSRWASHSSSPWQRWWNLSSYESWLYRNLIPIRGKWGGNKCSSSTRPDVTANLYWL